MPAPTTGQVVLDSIPLIVEPGTYSKGFDPLYSAAPTRLDSPINLSPFSTWRQKSFIGGLGQEKWSDDEMYYLGDADTREGWVQCKNALSLATGNTSDNSYKIWAIRPDSPGGTIRLYYASRLSNKLYHRATLAGAATTTWTAPSSTITALGRAFSGQQYGLHIGMNNGDIYVIPTSSNTVSASPTSNIVNSPIMFIDSLGTRGDIAGAGNGTLWKTTNGTTWTQFAKVDMPIFDGEMWNQQMWIVGHDESNRSALYTTDTVTTQEVFRWWSAFVAQSVVFHNGKLYILGYTFDNEFARRIGQIYQYDGASMRMVYQLPDEIWSATPSHTNWGFYRGSTYRKWLAFGVPKKGVWFYDPEQDAVSPGPILAGVTDDSGNFVTAVGDFGGRLIAANYNATHFHYQAALTEYKTSYVVTSEYDAGLPGQKKTWTRVRIRLRDALTGAATVAVKYTTQHIETDDESNPAWVSLGSATATNNTLTFSGNVTSEVIRFHIKLTPTTYSGSADNVTPKVEAFEVDYLVNADNKWGWQFQAKGGKGLTRPDDAAYSYTDGPALQAALESSRTNSNKRWVTFTDKDGTSYSVQILGMQFFYNHLDASNADGETLTVALQLGEV